MGDNTKKARDTLSSIYSFYASNKDKIEHPPSFVTDGSGDIFIGIRSSEIPTSVERTEDLKKNLQEYVKMDEVIKGIPPAELKMMKDAAYASTIKRKK